MSILGKNGGDIENGGHLKTQIHQNCCGQLSIAIRAKNHH
jgi:hypothetical protein